MRALETPLTDTERAEGDRPWPTGAALLITRRIITDTTGRTLAMEETRRGGEDTQLAYPLTPLAARDAPSAIPAPTPSTLAPSTVTQSSAQPR